MITSVINKNAFFREILRKYQANLTYAKIASAIEGEQESITKDDAKQICSALDDIVRQIKTNVNSSIQKS
jgi:hypothetical protein